MVTVGALPPVGRNGIDDGAVAADLAEVPGGVANLGGDFKALPFAWIGDGERDAAAVDVGERQDMRRLGGTIDRDEQAVADAGGTGAGVMLTSMSPFSSAALIQRLLSASSVMATIGAPGSERSRRALSLTGPASVAGDVGDAGGGDEIGVVGGRVELEIDMAGGEMGGGQGDHLIDVAAAEKNGQRIADGGAGGQGDADVDIVVLGVRRSR